MNSEPLKHAARAAWLYALPLIEIATTRSRGLARGQQMNTLAHVRALADHRHRAVTAPNNDTLYSSAQLDLTHGPVTISLPCAGPRYLSVALMDAYTNNFAILGTRTTGPEGGVFTLVGPREASDGAMTIRSPTAHVWMLARIAVYGPDDLEAARAVQAGVSLQGPAAPAPAPSAARAAPWPEYFADAARLIAANTPPVTDLGVLRMMAPIGLDGDFDPSRFMPAEVAAIEAGVAEARAQLRGGGLAGDHIIEGWAYPSADLGVFEQNYLFRARVALGGLAALPPAEAMYMRAEGTLPGALFDGARAWRMHFAPDGLPPVDSFWSLSLYEATPEGQYFFTDNPLSRYSIGDRTPGLAFNKDGSLDLWIGHADPGGARSSNWLPAPDGPFALFMRAYLPQRALLDGRYRLPPVTLG